MSITFTFKQVSPEATTTKNVSVIAMWIHTHTCIHTRTEGKTFQLDLKCWTVLADNQVL